MDSVEVREALQEPINTVIEEIKKTLGQTPPSSPQISLSAAS